MKEIKFCFSDQRNTSNVNKSNAEFFFLNNVLVITVDSKALKDLFLGHRVQGLNDNEC